MLKDEFRHINNFKSVSEQKSIHVRQHSTQWTERSSKELYKIKDFYKQKGAGTRKLYGLVMQDYFPLGMAGVQLDI